jgi:competence protein ComEC
VLRLKLGDVTIILGADSTSATEKAILKAYAKDLSFLQCNLLKIAHHGSDTSSSPEWIAATIGPKGNDRSIDVAVSADMRDGYGLPKCPIMQRYIDYGTIDKGGDVSWVCWNTDFDYWDDRTGKESILSTLKTSDQGVQWEYRTDGDNIHISKT